MATFLFIVFIIIIIIAVSGKKKTTTYATTKSYTTVRSPTSASIELTYKYYGNEWQNFVILKTTSFNQPKNFHETIAFALEKLSIEEQKKLLLTFLGVNSNSGNQSGTHTIYSIGLNNYENLHSATLNLVQSGRFSEISMLTLFRQQIDLKQQQRDEVKLKRKDYSIIDVTGSYEKIKSVENLTEFESWKLGNKFKDKLKLNTQEVVILNSLIDTDNKFNSIKFCAENLIRLLFNCLNHLDEYYGVDEHNNIKREIIDIEIKKQLRYRQGGYNYNNASIELIHRYNQCIYKTCENVLREHLSVGRKTDLSWYFRSKEALNLLDSKIISILKPFINDDLVKVHEIDIESEILINNYSRSRFKNLLNKIKSDYNKSEIEKFKHQINDLEKRNFENPFIENIYFEASKFISKFNKLIALEYYIKYIYFDLNSNTFDNKKLTKTIQKSLFKTNEQLHDFEKVVSELIKDKDLDKALKNVATVYEIKRKKIQLDSATIKEVQQQHSGTVELLNEYLKDDFEDENNSIKSHEISNEEIIIEITQKSDDIINSEFVNDLSFSSIHISALRLFSKSNFSVPQIEIEVFAKSKGIFKNQLIESMNETCYELLDDVLIEEEDDYYTINPDYFQIISAK